jgi:hypothetical protein
VALVVVVARGVEVGLLIMVGVSVTLLVVGAAVVVVGSVVEAEVVLVVGRVVLVAVGGGVGVGRVVATGVVV